MHPLIKYSVALVISRQVVTRQAHGQTPNRVEKSRMMCHQPGLTARRCPTKSKLSRDVGSWLGLARPDYAGRQKKSPSNLSASPAFAARGLAKAVILSGLSPKRAFVLSAATGG